jgi:hypothetical protein
MRALTRALDRNTRATDALHALLLDVERTRRTEASAAREDPQIIAKKGVRNAGMQIHFCTACVLIECEPGVTPNLWTATGCNCCKLGHNLLGGN